MSRFIQSSLLLLSLAVAGSASVYAQNPEPPQGPPPPRMQGMPPRGGSPAMEIRMLTKRLNLSPDQAAQLEPILADREARIKELRPAPGSQPDFKALRDEHKAIQDDTKAKINGILNAEQQQEFAKMHDRFEPRGPRGPRGNERPQGPPPPNA